MDEGSHGHSQRGHSSSSTVHQYLTVRWVRPDDYCSHDYCSYSGEDRISELPDSILIHILSFLPIGDVIATATLSKRWRFLWPVVPNLVFNRTSAPPVSFIDRALLFNECSQIKKFSVGSCYKTEFQSAVDVWLRVATRRNVEELDLDFDAYWWDSRDMYKLPQYLYTNLSLVKLALRRCSMNPSGVISWPSLKSLSIGCKLELNDKLVEDILSGSPVLEYLQLYSFSGINRLNITSATLKKLVINGCERRDSGEGSVLQISAPKVESLSILGHMRGKVCSVTNVPSLLRATLDFELKMGGPCGSYRKLVTDLFKALNHVEELTIGAWCLQVLSLLELTNLISSTSKFKSLILSTGSDKWDHPGIANLLRSSVYLETLVINMSDTYCSDDVHKHIMLQLHHSLNSSTVLEWPEGFAELYRFDQEKYWNSQEGVLVNSLQRLKTVKIVNDSFNGEHIEQLVELLRVLLKNARVLEKMVICEQEYVDHPASFDSLEAARRLICFPRASPNAVLILPRTLY